MNRPGGNSQRRRKRAHDRRTALARQRLTHRKVLITGLRVRQLATLDYRVQSVDWRAKYPIPAGQQGDCQSCSAFATASAVALQSRINGKPLPISPGYLHTCIGHAGQGNSTTVCNGAIDLGRLLDLLKEKGWATSAASTHPYPLAACQVGGAVVRLRSYTVIRSETEAKAALGRGPLVAVMSVSDEFFSFRGNLYRSLPALDDSLHSVCVTGFNRDGWIILNSCGADWGDSTGGTTIASGACGLLDFRPGGQNLQAYAIGL
ncbi:C1 family peptidase [Janthinobacterium sp. 75]|uniref:C1 family peptidase n=1 Tax=Janthinobacterium sp. 75 TaxID=2135628 RepID=UPI001062D55F|nr:C1 family peptidase [Janthinobacterium sp. 75]TDY35337.1 papain like protease [Janthinobacterium sp. 75]